MPAADYRSRHQSPLGRRTPTKRRSELRALRAVFDDESIDEINSADLSGSYPVIQYGPPNEDYVIDLLARLGEAFTFDNIDSEELVMEGVTVRVATPSMLYRMKRSTVRPQDRVDAESLRERFGITDEGDQR